MDSRDRTSAHIALPQCVFRVFSCNSRQIKLLLQPGSSVRAKDNITDVCTCKNSCRLIDRRRRSRRRLSRSLPIHTNTKKLSISLNQYEIDIYIKYFRHRVTQIKHHRLNILYLRRWHWEKRILLFLWSSVCVSLSLVFFSFFFLFYLSLSFSFSLSVTLVLMSKVETTRSFPLTAE